MYDYRSSIFFRIFGQVLIKAILPLAQLYLSAQVIDWLMNGEDIQTYLTQLAVFIGVITVLKIIEQQLSVTEDQDRELFRNYGRDKIKAKYITMDYPLTVGKDAQEKYNNAITLTWNFSTLFGRITNEFVEFGGALVGLILYSHILSQLDRVFLLYLGIFILFVIIFNILQVKMDKKMYNVKAKINQRWRYLRSLYGESRLTKDVRIFQMQNWFTQVEDEADEEYYKAMKPKVWLTWCESSIVNVGIIGLTAFSYIHSVRLIWDNIIPISSFVVYAGLVTILAQSIMQFVNVAGKLSNSLNETGKYDAFMSQKDVFLHDEGKAIPENPLMIELENVTYTYPNNEESTIKDLSLAIQANEKLAIVGENGAGKSTLTNLICGLIQPDSGEIRINNVLQKDMNINDYYSLFAAVFQEKILLTYTIKETILQGLPFEKERYEQVIELSGLKAIIEKFEKGDDTPIVKEVYDNAVRLSGGQLQKVKLAQALYKDAPILILDEPTAALDAIAEHQIYQDYFRFSKDKTSIFVSHRLSSTRFCDRIIYLNNGKIIEVGTHEKLMENKQGYFELYEAQAYYYKSDREEKEQDEEVLTGGVI